MTENYSELVGLSIKALLSKKGLGQSVVVDALGVSQASVSRMLSGKTAMNINQLYKISEALTRSVADVLPKDMMIEELVCAWRLRVDRTSYFFDSWTYDSSIQNMTLFREGRQVCSKWDDDAVSVKEFFELNGVSETHPKKQCEKYDDFINF